MAAGTLAVGSAHPETQVVLAAAVLALVVLNAIASGGLRWVPFSTAAFFALGLCCVQLVPLPSALVRLLSPRAADLRSEVFGLAPSFLPLSLDVPATVLEVCKGLMYTGMFLVVGRCATRERRARPILMSIAGLGVLLAVIAAVQRTIHTDTILGIYRVRSLPGSFVFGTFVNGNHAASVLILAALVSIGFAFEASRGWRVLSIGAATVSAVALFFTASRGGAISFVSGGFVLVLVLLSRRYGLMRGLALSLVVVFTASVAVLLLADSLRGRLMPGDARLLWDNQKTRGWGAAWRLIHDFPWTGVGRGAFEAVAASYRVDNEAVRLVFPENLPLQFLTEVGVLGTLILAVAFVIPVARVARRTARPEPPVVAAACGVLAVILHDLADFGLEMPGVALPTVVALGVVVGRTYGGRNPISGTRFPRVPIPAMAVGAAVWVAALVGGVWASGRTLTADGTRARDAVAQKSPAADSVIDDGRARHPADYYLELIAAIQKMQTAPSQVLHHLNRALRLNPANGETHALTARWLARVGRRAQAALEFRLARDHGVATDFEEIFVAVGSSVVEAVPQRPELLLALSQHLSAHSHPAAAEAAARRAVERSENPDGALTNVIDIAMATGEPARMIRAAGYVLDARPGAVPATAAAKALFRAGDNASAQKALEATLLRIPDDPTLLLSAARLRLEFGDPVGARDLLLRNSDAQQYFHLADMVSLQQLLAEVADRTGDTNAAIIARARGRMFLQRLSESQPSAGFGGGPPAPR